MISKDIDYQWKFHKCMNLSFSRETIVLEEANNVNVRLTMLKSNLIVSRSYLIITLKLQSIRFYCYKLLEKKKKKLNLLQPIIQASNQLHIKNLDYN